MTDRGRKHSKAASALMQRMRWKVGGCVVVEWMWMCGLHGGGSTPPWGSALFYLHLIDSMDRLMD